MAAKRKSEFGQGLSYNLALFLCHESRSQALAIEWTAMDEQLKAQNKPPMKLRWPPLWFNGSSDHLYDLQIPESFPPKLRKRLALFQSKCLHWGHGFPPPEQDATEDDVHWSLEEARNLLVAVDKAHGIDAIKGQWE